MKSKFLRLLVVALLGALVAPLPAVLSKSSIPAAVAADANTTTAGYQFNVTFNPPQAASGAWTIYMASTQTGTITITWPDGASPTVLNVAPGAITSQAILAKYYLLASEHGAINNRVTRISATVPISVYGCMVQAAASDCTNFIPTANLGTAYRALYAKSQFGSTYPEHITVVNGADTSTITITSVAAITTSEYTFPSAGAKEVVTLSPYQVWTSKLQTSGQDFSGTLIESTAQVGFLNGALCENFSTTFTAAGGACDNAIQLVPPISTWGTTFYSVNYKNSGATGSGYRIVASADSTTVSVSGDFTGSKTLNAGEVYTFQAFAGTGSAPNKSIVISSTKPVLVGHYMFNGQYVSVGGTDTGDPSMSYLTPYQQYLATYTVTNPSSFKVSLINVVAPQSVKSTLLLDGAIVPLATYRDIAGSTWTAAQVMVASGTHTISAPAAFGVEVYGAGSYDSYAYTGGQNFSSILNVASLSLAASSFTASVGQQICIPVSVLDANGGAVQGVRVDAVISGVSSTTVGNALANASGIATICYTGNAAGSDKVTFSANGNTIVANVTWSVTAPVIAYAPSTVSVPTGSAMSNLVPTNTGSAATWTISPPLPAGMSFDAATGLISGTPTAATSSATYTVTATNTGGTATTTVTLEVTASVNARSISYATVAPLALDGAITPITPTVAGSFTAWSISPSLPTGLVFNTQTGVITGTPSVLSSATTYTVSATASGASTSTTVSISVIANAPVISYSSNAYTFVKNVAITSQSPTNTGSPATTWRISPALPAGLSFNGSTGLISGAATAASTSTSYTVTATNTAGSGSTTFSITVLAALAAPNISYSPSTASGAPGSSFTPMVASNTGGPATFTISPALPTGLSINPSTHQLVVSPVFRWQIHLRPLTQSPQPMLLDQQQQTSRLK